MPKIKKAIFDAGRAEEYYQKYLKKKGLNICH